MIEDALFCVELLGIPCNKLSYAVFSLMRVKNICTKEGQNFTYNSRFESHACYVVVLWLTPHEVCAHDPEEGSYSFARARIKGELQVFQGYAVALIFT